MAATAETQATPDPFKQRIGYQIAELQRRQKADATAHEIAIRWARLGATYGNAGEVAQAEAAYNHALRLVETEKYETELYADVLDQLGALYRIYGRTADALRCYRKAFAVRAPMLDPLEDARSRARLAEVALITRDYKQAYAETDKAYGTMQRMFDPDSSEVVSTLIVRAYAQCGLHHAREARQDAAEALRLSKEAFAEDSMQVAASLTILGYAAMKDGDTAAAERSLQHSVDLLHKLVSGSDPRLVFAMGQYHHTLVSLHRKDEARQVKDELEALARQPQTACSNCTVSAFSMRPREASQAAAVNATVTAAGTVRCPLAPPGGAAAAWMPRAPGHPEL